MNVQLLYRVLASPFIDDAEKREHLDNVCKDAPWGQWSRILERERLASFCLAEFSRLSLLECLPASLASKWRRVTIHSTVQGEKYVQMMGQIVDVADAQQIPLLCMRTPYLNARLYSGNLAVRPFADIDIALKPEHRTELVQSLRSNFGHGFRHRGDGPGQRLKSEFGSRMELDVNGVLLDLHWDLTLHYNFFRNSAQADRQTNLWKRARTATIGGKTINVLSDADLLLHLVQHCAIQHDMKDRPFSQLVDIVRLVADSDDAEIAMSVKESMHDYCCPTALATVSKLAIDSIEGAESNPLLCSWSGRVRRTARRTVRNYIHERQREFCQDSRPQRERYQSFKSIPWWELAFAAAIMDGGRPRASLARQCVFPSRSILSYAMDRPLSAQEYFGFLCTYIPVGWYFALPILSSLIAQQVGDLIHRTSPLNVDVEKCR